MKAIQPKNQYEHNFALLMPPSPNKDVYSRLLFFLDWLEAKNLPWYHPTLDQYQRYLTHERTRPHPQTGESQPALLSPAAANAHLATIRGRYRALLSSNAVRQQLYDALPQDVTDPANRKALVDELLIRLENDIHPRHSTVTEITVQDQADAEHIRLTPSQVRALVRAPGVRTLSGLRDTALLALLACTGIREAELVALDVADLRQTLGGELALRIRQGKDSKQRLVPYGPLDWCLVYVERWLTLAKITAGAVFRGVYKGDKHVRATRISERAVHQIMQRYPIPVDGVLTAIQPHDLRRTYARNAYLHGMDLERIRQNLGHSSVKTTQVYVGTLNAEQRRPPDMFRLPHSPKELAQPLSQRRRRRRKQPTG
jgi:site-specific recombinase XerD